MSGRFKKNDRVYCANKKCQRLNTINLVSGIIYINLGSGQVLEIINDDYYDVIFEYTVPGLIKEEQLYIIKTVHQNDLEFDGRKHPLNYSYTSDGMS